MKAHWAGRMASAAGGRPLLALLAISGILVVLGGAPVAARAQEFPRGTMVKAIAFYDTKGPNERLVSVVLHPVGNGAEPQLQSGPRITRRALGTGSPEQFSAMVRGMKQKALVDKGRLLAAVYFVSVTDGDYANIVSYLLGKTQIVVEDPANLKPIEGGGSDGGGGGGGGGSH